MIAGGGHAPHVRYPVAVNHAIREYVDRQVSRRPKQSAWLFARERKRRALWVCSPIGLGHILRDIAVARSLREQVPDLEIHWWAQQPVTAVLEAEGEIIHPASAELASESAHWESEAAQHDLHAFYAFRRMDEIFCANYMLFDDVVRETHYDLWVGDESWEIDHFLHENPERKIAPYAFLTDVIGFLPVDPEGDPREAELCADYNAEMIEHRARYPYVRDRSVFIGGFGELPDASFGPGLPGIREWSSQWFTSVPYVVPFAPSTYRRPAALRARLGYGTGFPLYVAAVGGTSVGRHLLELDLGSFALVRKEQADARLVMVTGPRLHPGLAARRRRCGEGRLRACPVRAPRLRGRRRRAGRPVDDDGVGRGTATVHLLPAGAPLGTTALRDAPAEPLRRRHRMDYATTSAGDLAAAMRTALAQGDAGPGCRQVPRGGASRAASRIAALLAGQ